MAMRFLIVIALALVAVSGLAYLYWRHVWFFRNPPRTSPPGEGILSPADGTVVYVKEVQAFEPVVVIKKGVSATVNDILREDEQAPRLIVGVFMSPFNVHYNRAPISGRVDFVHYHPPIGSNLHMGAMHLRTLLNRQPHYENSLHIVQNERKVTRISGHYQGKPLACYVVQIAARTVSGIDSYVNPGESVERGAIFGMIRIGSQVDLVVPWRADLRIRVRAGDRVRAGETVLID